ncbi:MAG: UDPGP type 1 family protein [Planctomycetota bacterium]
MTTEATTHVREQLESLGQAHVLRFFDDLDAAQQQALLGQLESIDLDRLPALIETYVQGKPDFGPSGALQPAPYYPADPTNAAHPWDRDRYRAAGEQLIRDGKVSAFTVAGGQGSRLGFDGPKGKFPGGAATGKPLFHCFADWIVATRDRYGAAVPWYIMTSPINHDETVAFFRDHAFFGLPERDVMFFSQGVMPSLAMETGHLLLSSKGAIATNPDGHGGSLKALWDSGAIRDMQSRGVEHISYFQVDNPIVRAIDPVFIGLHATAPDSSGEMSAKIVRKTDPAEKVGVICEDGGVTKVIEYSDLPGELAEARAEDGSLRYCAGSIAIHVIGVDFVEKLNTADGGFALPFHRAEKKVPHIDAETGVPVSPDAPNAVKLETFVFDALPLCEKSLVYETERVEEFAPIKNAEGNDSPATCAQLQTQRAAGWLEQAGFSVPRKADGTPDCTIEISPCTALWPEDLRGKDIPPITPGDTVAL